MEEKLAALFMLSILSSQGSQYRNTDKLVLDKLDTRRGATCLHPGRHGVRVHGALVVVEDEDGADHAAGHHRHDHREVDADERRVAGGRHHRRHHVHEEGEGHQDRDAQRQLLPRVGRGLEAEDDHAGYHDAGDDQVVEVINSLPLDGDLVGDINVECSKTAIVLNGVPSSLGAEQHPLRVLLVIVDIHYLALV